MGYGGTEQLVHLPSMGRLNFAALQADIAAAREQYNQARDDYKQFLKDYGPGSFVSGIDGDNQLYADLTYNRLAPLINTYGVDNLIRSQEGKAMLNNMIASTDIAAIAGLKQNAQDFAKFQDSVDALKKSGKYSEDFLRFQLARIEKERGLSAGSLNPEEFSSLDSNGKFRRWGVTSAVPYTDLYDVSSPWFSGIKDSFIETDKQGRDWHGVTKEHLAKAADENLAGFLSTELGQYHLMNAKRQLEAMGIDNPNDKLVKAQLIKNVIDTQGKLIHRDFEYNKKYMMDLQAKKEAGIAVLKNQLATNRERAKAEQQADLLRLKASLGGSGSGSKSGSGKQAPEGYVESWNQMARGASNIVSQSSFGPQFNVHNADDFDPELMSTILPKAQAEIADKFYGTPNKALTMDAQDYQNIQSSLASGKPMPQVFKMNLNPKLGLSPSPKVTLSPTYSRNKFARTETNYWKDKSFNDIKDNPKEANDIRQANYKFISALSMDYDAAKFGHWMAGTGFEDKGKEDGSSVTYKDVFKVRNTDVNRFVVLDDVALRASGVNSNGIYDRYAALAMKGTSDLQKQIEQNPENYTFQLSPVSKPVVGLLGPDGAYHMYAWVTVKDKTTGKNITDGSLANKRGAQILYDMGIDSYSVPGYNASGDNLTRMSQFVNMYIDPYQNADSRMGADMRAGKYLNLAKPKIGYDAIYPSADSDYEDDMNMILHMYDNEDSDE